MAYKLQGGLPAQGRRVCDGNHNMGLRVILCCHQNLLEACLRNGWLRIVDQSAIEEVQALLRNDPVFLPVPSSVDSRLGEIDFTPCGATLYRMIAAEWLGPDWEDALSVSDDYYREEHRYCEDQTVLQGIAEGYVAKGEVVRETKIVPIGPWCVWWWERFPAGFRLEIKIGTP